MRYQNGGFSTSSCNTTETLMFFECDKTAQWNVKNPNITGYINNDLQDGCNVRYLFISFIYHLFSLV